MADAEVVEEVVVLEAARTEREARRLADDGDFDGASGLLARIRVRLRRAAPQPRVGLRLRPGSNVVEVYVRYLRKKLGDRTIETVRGMGYRLSI